MGRRRIHKQYRKLTAPQVTTSIIVSEALWNVARHLAVDEKKSVGRVLEDALRLLLKTKGKLPPELDVEATASK